MVLKVDLQCCSCYKKVKKILCKFPQIRDQIYDEKGNTVTIKVVCCDPEKFRDKLCCKGCGVIKSIEIKQPPKPKPPEKPKEPEKPKVIEKPKEPEKPKVVPKEPEKPKPKEPEKPKEPPKPQPVAPPPAPQPVPIMPVQEYPQPPPGYCCGQCYHGHTGGPCYQWYGRPVPPPPCYNYCGYSYGPGPYGYGKGCYVSRCDQYFSDENATGCSIM